MTNNPVNRQQWIYDLLKVEKLKRNQCYPKYTQVYPDLSFETFKNDWEIASKRIKDYRIKVNKETDEASIATEVDAVIKALKSKFQWVAELQKELDENRVEESVLDLKTGKVIRFFRTMTPTERKGYMERISKFMGMDAPIKSADTNPDGSAKEAPKQTFTPDQLDKVLSELKKKK